MRAAGLVSRTGISPTGLTIAGFVFNLGVAYVLAQGQFQLGGVLVLVAGLFDTLDGAVARATGRVTRFGGFIDSTLDRLSEGAVYFGLLYYYAQQGWIVEPLLIYLTIVGSFMVSYTRARAEGLGLSCKVGLFTRLERLLVLALSLLFVQMTTGLILLAVGSMFTTLQRIVYVWQNTRE
ncbi:MAG: hypothetical protein A2Z04_06235 [Chloroflexi bacterium RBG_16_57_9]|nr:MAG: hypothetical protein A2Z04_06235 [Chloroflexi bacterium RBG_16_57_9]